MNGQSSTSSVVNGAKGVSLQDLPKFNVFSSNLPADEKFPTPLSSYEAPRNALGPRMVKNATYTYVRPEEVEDPELLAVSSRALHDIGLLSSEATSTDFKALVAGNKILWDPSTRTGIYPWAQCYGGWQFGSWAGQLGDGRAISLFESTNSASGIRYEIQLKGAGKTPYSRFADGKAVLRSSIREFLVSEYLNALNIPTTRALALTLTPNAQVRRERMEPGAIVCRFAQSWLRIGTFDILRARGDRVLIRRLATYLAENVFSGWKSLTPSPEPSDPEINRFTRLYSHIVRLNARTVAAWQAYGFTNGVLNTDNTSLMGLSLDFGPFAFLDNFDPAYTPNHDDHLLRYAYRAQPSVIWWNLVRLGESLGELIGAGSKVDDPSFISSGVSESFAPELISRAEKLIEATGEDYKATFLAEYKRLMTLRLGLKTQKDSDFEDLMSELLDTMETLELDFHHFFRRLSTLSLVEIETHEKRLAVAPRFFHTEGVTGIGNTVESASERIAKWLALWQQRAREDWASDTTTVNGNEPMNTNEPADGTNETATPADTERQRAMQAVNPNFVARGWVLDEIIERVSKGEREVLRTAMTMGSAPFEERWEGVGEEGERWVRDPPSAERMKMCSCSS
ncbi:hypothetical protein MMC34_005657 [Xylographa carneopallida]|nr:hypothetical protein [Xylographa carneopallida]